MATPLPPSSPADAVTTERAVPLLRRRSPFVVLVSIVVVLLVAELGVRLIDAHLPPPLVWHTYEAQKKVAQIDRLQERGGVDIAFLGTSMMNTGLSASGVSRLLGNGVTAYNAALSSQIGRQAELWTRAVVLPKLHPKVLVIGLISYDFTNQGRSRTAFYDAFVRSTGAERSLGGSTPLDKVNRWLDDHSALWSHRFQLRSPGNVWDAVRGRTPSEPGEVAAIGPDGRSTAIANRRFEERVLGFGLDVSAWTPGTTDIDAYERLVRRAKAAGVKVALIDMPVTEQFIARHPRGQADYDTYRRLLREFATEASVPVLDVGTINDHALFADEIHLNAAGSRVFTAAVADALSKAGLVPGP